ncbi:hypothetical protein GCM10011332_20900 [Terasakiella brassicae]|uniref:Uncharacterized protein n=1 Tax=Terasakiella brassicae TaxID=1634917 RepID=A0A917C2C0_9PROT|nr:hypothetical protein [Terasakiella brassicae]GGF66593.1 hypothetical protein GCM10011332_20900 [Terasakiella brassicae]
MLNSKDRKPFIHITTVMLLALIASSAVMWIYLNGPLQGDINNHILTSEKYGIPQSMQERGIEPFMKGQKELGWDGQFYYYISNDLLGVTDIPRHIDSIAYRYQRIGLPLLANIVSKVTFQSWVTPTIYYLTSLLLVILASGAAALFFSERNVNPYYALFWTLGLGTQITLVNGLPDAAADALLILALTSLARGKLKTYGITILLAALSREAYVIIPCSILLGILVREIQINGIKVVYVARELFRIVMQNYVHWIPILLFGAWHVYVRAHFNQSPSSQAHGILGAPLAATFDYLMAGINGDHPKVGPGQAAHKEAAAILSYLLLLFLVAKGSFALVSNEIIKKERNNLNDLRLGVGIAFILIVGLYICFGDTVMFHHTGFLKAANIFIFLLPFMAALSNTRLKKFIISFLVLTVIFHFNLLGDRIAPLGLTSYYAPPQKVEYVDKQPACLTNFSSRLTPSFDFKWLKQAHILEVNTVFENLSDKPFSPYQGAGTVRLSYHWLEKKTNKVLQDGLRTDLPKTLPPGHSLSLDMKIQFPESAGEYILVLSPVQEGCAWFYMVDPSTSIRIPMDIH